MALKTGTLDISTLMAATNQTVADFGEDNIAEIINADNAAFSAVVTDALGDLASTTQERLKLVGSSLGGNAVEVDETGQGPTQKDAPGYFVGLPLRRIQFPIGWTQQWLKNAKAADVAIRNGIAQGAHLRRARYEMQRAIYTPTNTSFTDHLVDKVSLPVKAFINADSSAMANGPNGEVFNGGSHTHYDAISSLTAAALTALIQDVLEHRNGARVRVCINAADVGTVSVLSGFVPLPLPYIVPSVNADHATTPIQMLKTDNRQIGWFGAAEVWTKPWAVANYAVAYDLDATTKPLARRVEVGDRGMHIAGTNSSHPLVAEYTEWFYGFGAWNRTALAVLQFNNGSYSAPTLSY